MASSLQQSSLSTARLGDIIPRCPSSYTSVSGNPVHQLACVQCCPAAASCSDLSTAVFESTCSTCQCTVAWVHCCSTALSCIAVCLLQHLRHPSLKFSALLLAFIACQQLFHAQTSPVHCPPTAVPSFSAACCST